MEEADDKSLNPFQLIILLSYALVTLQVHCILYQRIMSTPLHRDIIYYKINLKTLIYLNYVGALYK